MPEQVGCDAVHVMLCWWPGLLSCGCSGDGLALADAIAFGGVLNCCWLIDAVAYGRHALRRAVRLAWLVVVADGGCTRRSARTVHFRR